MCSHEKQHLFQNNDNREDRRFQRPRFTFFGHRRPIFRTQRPHLAPRQLSIFNNSGLHTVVRDVKEALNQAVRESDRSREQVLDAVNELARRHGLAVQNRAGVSKDLFEKWLNPEDDCRVPTLKSLALICAALGTIEPLTPLVEAVGGRVIDDDEARLLEWAKAYHQTRQLKKKMRKLEEEL